MPAAQLGPPALTEYSLKIPDLQYPLGYSLSIMLWSLIKEIYEAPGGKAAALQSWGWLELTCTLQPGQGEEQGQAPTFPVGMIPQCPRGAAQPGGTAGIPQ